MARVNIDKIGDHITKTSYAAGRKATQSETILAGVIQTTTSSKYDRGSTRATGRSKFSASAVSSIR